MTANIFHNYWDA